MRAIEELGLVRIDDRLIHGQVIAVWCKQRRFDRIVIVDDGVAADSFMQEVLSLAAPPGLQVDVFSIEDGIQILNEDTSNWETTMVLMKSPLDGKAALRWRAGVPRAQHRRDRQRAGAQERFQEHRRLERRGRNPKVPDGPGGGNHPPYCARREVQSVLRPGW